jgi:hypothetical protein
MTETEIEVKKVATEPRASVFAISLTTIAMALFLALMVWSAKNVAPVPAPSQTETPQTP